MVVIEVWIPDFVTRKSREPDLMSLKRKTALGEFEYLVLLAVLGLGEEAVGVAIARELEEKAGRRVSRGALYSALDRLEQKTFLGWSEAGTVPERGGHPMRRFAVTAAGLAAIREHRRAVRRLSAGLEEILGEGG
jgi:PadR family transcriptional regulator, regulatory protein PadR